MLRMEITYRTIVEVVIFIASIEYSIRNNENEAESVDSDFTDSRILKETPNK
jgi:hypothetical protein